MNENIFFSVVYNDQPIMNVESLQLPFIIGSGEMSNLRIREEFFRPQHIAIVKSGSNIVVKDLSGQPSINLNGRTLSEFVVMDSEVFSVGNNLACKIGFIIDEEEELETQEPIETRMDDVEDATIVDFSRPANIETEKKQEPVEKTSVGAPEGLISLGEIDEKTTVHELTEVEKTFIMSQVARNK